MSAFHLHLQKGRELVIRNPVSALDATIRSSGLLNCDRHRLPRLMLCARALRRCEVCLKNRRPPPPSLINEPARQEVTAMLGGT
jgi:hypothetical protein